MEGLEADIVGDAAGVEQKGVALAGGGGEVLENDGIGWLLGTVKVDHLAAFGGGEWSGGGDGDIAGSGPSGVPPRGGKVGAGREGNRNLPPSRSSALHLQSRSSATATCYSFQPIIFAGRPWISRKNSNMAGHQWAGFKRLTLPEPFASVTLMNVRRQQAAPVTGIPETTR